MDTLNLILQIYNQKVLKNLIQNNITLRILINKWRIKYKWKIKQLPIMEDQEVVFQIYVSKFKKNNMV